ncbi:hypothetical protein APHAL10511_008092 [Amanita phalloides]|nr:hypothetical protein APHAL10511_008092 [Amanita phalloides]
MSITLVALLVAPVISMPLPSEILDVGERDTAVLQRRQFAALFKFVFNIGKLIAKGISKLKHLHHHHHHHNSLPKTVHHALSNNNGSVSSNWHHSKHGHRKRDILVSMEERGGDDHDLNARGELDELD